MTPAPVASNPVLSRVLIVGGIVTAALAVIIGIVGLVVAGTPGLFSGLIGVVLGALFLAITGASILIANRWNGDPIYPTLFFAIVLGGWVIKFIVFIIALVMVKNSDWVERPIFFIGLVVSVIATLVVDVIVMKSMRIPYVSDIDLPESVEDEIPFASPDAVADESASTPGNNHENEQGRS